MGEIYMHFKNRTKKTNKPKNVQENRPIHLNIWNDWAVSDGERQGPGVGWATVATVSADAVLQWVVSPQICSILKQRHICSFPTWICLYIINGSPRRRSRLQLVSKARADTELPLLLTKRLSDRGCTSNTGESKENCRGSNNASAASPLPLCKN